MCYGKHCGNFPNCPWNGKKNVKSKAGSIPRSIQINAVRGGFVCSAQHLR